MPHIVQKSFHKARSRKTHEPSGGQFSSNIAHTWVCTKHYVASAASNPSLLARLVHGVNLLLVALLQLRPLQLEGRRHLLNTHMLS